MLKQDIINAVEGDENALCRVILKTTKLRESIARKFDKSYYEDLLNEGVLGIINAIKNYKKSKSKNKNKPYTYLSIWMYMYMERFLSKNEFFIRIPAHSYSNLKKIKKYIEKYIKTNGHEPGLSDISKHTGLDIYKVHDLLLFSDVEICENVDYSSNDIYYDYEYTINGLKRIISNMGDIYWETIYDKWLNTGGKSFKKLEDKYNVSRQTIKNRQDRCFKLLKKSKDIDNLCHILNLQ